MKILILSQYFLPETGAPQNRLKYLCLWLKQNGHLVEILTALPNYPSLQVFSEYKNLKYKNEIFDGITINRVNLFLGTKKSLKNRLLTYLSFAYNAWDFGRKKWKKGDWDCIFCESPPLFLGITAVVLKNRFSCRLWVNISDLWPESIEKLGLVKFKSLLLPFYKLELWLYKNSDFISGQTIGICNSINNRYDLSCHFYPNGIAPNEIIINELFDSNDKLVELFKKKVIIYSGNFGYAQGLEILVNLAERYKSNNDLKFVLIGDGPEKSKLLQMILLKSLNNIHVFSSIPRNVLFTYIKKSFASFVHLRNIPLFEGAIPSKIFEPLFLKTPVLMGVNGEAKEMFVGNNAVFYFEPENLNSLSNQIEILLTDNIKIKNVIENGYNLVTSNFNRDVIHTKLFDSLNKFIK